MPLNVSITKITSKFLANKNYDIKGMVPEVIKIPKMID